MVDGIQDPLFIAAPQGRQQVPLGAVPGETVDHQLPGNVADTVLQYPDVDLQGHGLHPARFPLQCQVCAPEDVQQMKFDAICTGTANILRSFCHHLRCFSRQAQNLVDHYGQSPAPQLLHRPVEYRQVIAPADVLCRGGMDGL